MTPAATARSSIGVSEPVAPRESAELRKAALLLHALPGSDRAWVIAELAESERAALQPLVVELEELGMPMDRELLDQVLASPEPAAANQERDASQRRLDPVRTLADADPAALAELLRDEPAALVARLLEIAEWPWRRAVLRRVGSARRMEITACLSPAGGPERSPDAEGSEPAAALRSHLVEVVLRRLEEQRGARRGLRGWVHGWPWRRRSRP